MTPEPRRKPGPKPRLGETIAVNVNLPKALVDAIDTDADAEKVSRSEIVRRRLGCSHTRYWEAAQ